MALKERQTPLMASNNATYKTVEGVTYFKLKSEFEGDYTKHCGLLGEEIDENFYFLRGYDIETVTLDDKKNLIIQRVDKDYAPIIINMEDTIEHPTFEFDKENGKITVTYPDGTIKVMDGFFVEGRDVRIATDSTINGNGTKFNPLRIAEVETTGTFAPADEYFDLTEVGSVMPEGKGKGYRVVTKEKIDNFGCLYPFSAVKKIQDKLTETGSQWRVPSKEDWDELLNALECPEDRNHSAITCTWLGKVAGSGLKSANLWNEHQTLPTEIPTNGQDVRGLTVYPVGITPDRNEILNQIESNHDAEGFGQIAGMWTSTINDEGNAYVKVFGYNSAKVDQDTYGDGARMSIRLVKEYAYDNFNEIENILGFPYPTELVYGIHDDYPYVKIWTKINLYSDAEALNGIRSEEWSAVTDSDKGVKIVYFINEWDGTEWHKKPMGNGDSVVILTRTVSSSISYYMKKYNIKTGTYEYIQLTKAQGEDAIKQGFVFTELNILPPASDNTPEYVVIEKVGGEAFYHEWRIIEGELVDTADAIINEFNKELNEVKEDIYELSAITKELVIFSSWTVETINEFSAATEEHINRIDSTIAIFSAATVEEIARLDKDIAFISGEVQTLSSATVEFSAATVEEIARLDKDIAFISGEVQTLSSATVEFSAATVSEIERLDGKIDNLSAATVEFSASTVEEIARLDGKIDNLSAATVEFSASTVEEIARLDGKIDELSATTEAFSAATVKEIARLDVRIDEETAERIANDLTPGEYVLPEDHSSEMVLPTNSEEVEDIHIKIHPNFFNFGEFGNIDE